MYVVQVRTTTDVPLTLLNGYGEEYGTAPAGEWYTDHDMDPDDSYNQDLAYMKEVAERIKETYEESGQTVQVRVMKQIIAYEEVV